MDDIKKYSKFHLTMVALIATSCFLVATIALITYKHREVAAESAEAQIATYPNPFDHVALQAKAAYVLDLSTGKVLYAKNANTSLPLASLTKVMTALVASEYSTENKIVSIDNRALAQDGEYGLKKNEKWKFKDLLDLTLVESSNDGAAAVADAVENDSSFISLMNKKAQEIGLTHTQYKNETGLDLTSSTPGATGSARDMAYLMKYVLDHKPDILDATRYNAITVKSLDGAIYRVHNTNDVTGKIPNLIASKTGFTDLAGGNLLVAFDAGLNRPVVIAVIGSTEEGRFTDVMNLASTTLNYISLAER